MRDPAERQLRQRGSAGDQRPKLLRPRRARRRTARRKRLSLVEGLTLAIELTMIVRSADGVDRELARQQTARQRDAREDADLPPRSDVSS